MKVAKFTSKAGNGCCMICDESNNSPSHIVQHFHPQYVEFFISKRRKDPSIRRSWRLRIKLRCLRLRFRSIQKPIFHCSLCSYGSNSIALFRIHTCKKLDIDNNHNNKNGKCNSASNSPFGISDEVVVQELQVGSLLYRSRCKDSLAILEKAANPGEFELTDFCANVKYNLQSVDRTAQLPVPSLRAIVTNCLNILMNPSIPAITHLPSHLFFVDLASSYRILPRIRKFSTGFYCAYCQSVFFTYRDFDDHLDPDTGCKGSDPDPIPVGLRTESNVPADYDLGLRFPKFFLSDRSTKGLQCQSCQDSTFSSIHNFHQHLIDCSRKQLYDVLCDSPNDNYPNQEQSVNDYDMEL